MLVTLIQHDASAPPLQISVCEHRADAVIRAMAADGWHVLSKFYGPGPVSAVVDCLQVALLEVSTLPASALVRVVVERGAAAAILCAPTWAATQVTRGSKRDRDQRHGVTGALGQDQSARRQRLNTMH